MMESNKGAILVTGAAGFIGSAVAVRLAAMGHTVVGCDNFNDYYDPALKHHRVEALLKLHEPLPEQGMYLTLLLGRSEISTA